MTANLTTASLNAIYPESRAGRDRWIVERRPQRNPLDPLRPYAFFVEDERAADGAVVPVATILLTNRECPWRCLMCDLWKNTLAESAPAGAIPAQIDYALARLPPARQIKLYNSGSFFDPRAIPLADHAEIAAKVGGFERVIVESHPALAGEGCFRFQRLLSAKLEVAMGLETAHPEVLEKLNKGFALPQFAAAAEALRRNGIDLRVFLLVDPPFLPADEALQWAKRSLEFAFGCGAVAATLIPTRSGNGAIEALAEAGEFAPPRLAALEAAMEHGIGLGRGRVFVDLWDASPLVGCPGCRDARIERMRWMNLRQAIPARTRCELCGGGHGR